jgi:hypothetical protein
VQPWLSNWLEHGWRQRSESIVVSAPGIVDLWPRAQRPILYADCADRRIRDNESHRLSAHPWSEDGVRGANGDGECGGVDGVGGGWSIEATSQMISVVCVYNKESIYKEALLKGLRRQTAAYELIALDNSTGRFRSAAEAYNFGGAKAKGDYLMFVHQDVWLVTRTWMEDAERMVKDLPALGAAGVAGAVSLSSRIRRAGMGNAAHLVASCYYLDEDTVAAEPLNWPPEEAETLDECLLLVPRAVFDHLKFDEVTFDAWDCYASDYCLSASDMGLKSYVIPLPCSHCCTRSGHGRWEFKGLLKYQKRLYAKHGRKRGTICTWMGDVNQRNLQKWSHGMRLGRVGHRLLPNVDSFLTKELAGCESVLELGIGWNYLAGRSKPKLTVGLDLLSRCLEEGRRKESHTDYVQAYVGLLPFKRKSFDAVIALETIECVTKWQGGALIRAMEDLARKKVIVVTPNRHAEHRSADLRKAELGWEGGELLGMGFKVVYSGRRPEPGVDASRLELGVGPSKPKHQSAVLELLEAITDQLLVWRHPDLADKLMAVKYVDMDGRPGHTRG